jgi:MraZ protein
VLRGNAPAKIDEKGRLKIPSAFLALIAERHGQEVFVTSVTGESVRIYPMPVWVEIERKLGEIPSTLPARRKFFNRVSYFGQPGELDKQGRILIPARLREAADMTGEVDVFGLYNYLEVWNHDRFAAKLSSEPFTDDDARALSEFGI